MRDVVLGIWVECRRVLAIPGLYMAPLVIAVIAALDAHQGFILDVATGLMTAAFVALVILLVLILMRRIPAVRRSLDRRASASRLGR